MIEHVTISDLGVIEGAELDLDSGFNVVTGETGAGKTMVVTAFGLLLGARADAHTVRAGAAKAAVDAQIAVTPGHPAIERAEEAGALFDEDVDADAENQTEGEAELLLGRAVSAKGRSRASVSGRAVPISVLGDIGAELVTVHGQSDQLRLKSPGAQREALDSYAGPEFAQKLSEYQHNYETYRQQQAELEDITAHELERRREAEHLQQALEAIDEVDPQPGEDEQLKAESMKLENIETLRDAARNAQTALSGPDVADVADSSPSAAELVESASSALQAVVDQDDDLAATAHQISDISALITEAATQLGLYASGLDESGPERLAEVHARRAELDKLMRLYGPDISAVISWSEESRTRLMTLQSDEDRIAKLTDEVQRLETELIDQAAHLRELRREAAGQLGAAVGEELAALAMPQARLEVHVEPTEQLSRHGADTVSLLLAPHAGAHPLPLGRGASGGELSRVMLAIEVVLAEKTQAGTFIFDEVDAGVGGKAAVQIGKRLAMLARHAQVIVVTHLPQVAAHADQHIRVYKSSDAEADDGAGFTASDVRALSEQERVEELARMLAGQEDSDSAKAHAQELLEAAR